MAYLVLNLFIFIICSILHIGIHRFFARRGIFTLKTTLIFILGLIISMYSSGVLPYTEFWWNISIPYSGIVFYILLAGILIIFYTSPSFSYVSPSTMILKLLKKHGVMSYKEMRQYFSNEKIIMARLTDLQKASLIFSEKGLFRVTVKGKRIAALIDSYRKLFGWRTGG